MVSEAKLAANRRNAQRSTGPRTPEGKARSASNSTIHNFRSRRPPELTPEDHQAITQIAHHFRPDAQPQTPAEEAILQDFATAVHLRAQVEHALDEAFCTNEPTALKYLDRHHSAALTRFNRAYDGYKQLLHREIAICTNEPTAKPATQTENYPACQNTSYPINSIHRGPMLFSGTLASHTEPRQISRFSYHGLPSYAHPPPNLTEFCHKSATGSPLS